MSNIIPVNTQLPAHLRNAFVPEAVEDLTSGVVQGFPILSIRGAKWRVKSKGEEKVITDANGDAIPSISLVIVRASKNFSKVFYKGAYEEGDDSNPDCFSTDGEKPDASIQNPPSSMCANCPNNVWGSKITPQGTKTKLCQDNRRLVVVPSADMRNEALGGPMLLRLPPASLLNLGKYAEDLSTAKVNYFHVHTRASFDHESSYPKLVFRPAMNKDGSVRFLSGEEVTLVEELREDEQTLRIVNASAEFGSGDQAPPKEEAAAIQTDYITPDDKPFPVEPVEEPEATPAPAPKKKRTRRKAAKKGNGQEAGQAAATPQEVNPTQAKEDLDATISSFLDGMDFSED